MKKLALDDKNDLDHDYAVMDNKARDDHHHEENLCDKCGSPKQSKHNDALPPRIGRKRPQVNNQSFT